VAIEMILCIQVLLVVIDEEALCTIKLVHMDLMPKFLETIKLETQSMNNVGREEK
jgi:hypothetical protein